MTNKKNQAAILFALLCGGLLAGCGNQNTTASSEQAAAASTTAQASLPTPRFDDGTVRFDREPGKLGYWGKASQHALMEVGVNVPMNEQGLLANSADASKVAPFMDWALALYQYRQSNDLADDPVKGCISPAGPRHLQDPGGFRIIQDRNFNRVYVMFGGGNRNWRLIHLDGRAPPNPDEVTGTYYGYSGGHWEGDALVVESSGFNDRFWFSNGGLPHTQALHLTERFTRTDYDTLTYQVTINDPYTYTRPWNAEWTLDWVDGEIAEHFCEQ
jgi:hypothetical protein